jgi:hypothetical protein
VLGLEANRQFIPYIFVDLCAEEPGIFCGFALLIREFKIKETYAKNKDTVTDRKMFIF